MALSTHHSVSRVARHRVANFVPLAVVLAAVLALSALSFFLFAVPAMVAFMGWFFLVFGTFKAVRLRGFVAAYREYDVLAKRSRAYAYTYPFLEIAIGVAYLWQVLLVPVSVFVCALMLVGAWGVWLKLRAREAVPCACLGAVFKIPMTYVTLGEDVLMAVMAAWIVIRALL